MSFPVGIYLKNNLRIINKVYRYKINTGLRYRIIIVISCTICLHRMQCTRCQGEEGGICAKFARIGSVVDPNPKVLSGSESEKSSDTDSEPDTVVE
jgi:hypothetical protein